MIRKILDRVFGSDKLESTELVLFDQYCKLIESATDIIISKRDVGNGTSIMDDKRMSVTLEHHSEDGCEHYIIRYTQSWFNENSCKDFTIQHDNGFDDHMYITDAIGCELVPVFRSALAKLKQDSLDESIRETMNIISNQIGLMDNNKKEIEL